MLPIVLIGLLGACPPDGGGTATAPSTSESSTSSSTTSLASTTLADPTAGEEECPPFEGLEGLVNVEPVQYSFSVIDVCPVLADPSVQFTNFTGFNVVVYRPTVWPTVRLPTIIFAPGVGQDIQENVDNIFVDKYRHIFYPAVEDGFIVVGVEIEDRRENDVEFRRLAMACTLKWLETEWEEDGEGDNKNRRNCDVVVMGHSRGGEAAYNIVDTLDDLVDLLDLRPTRLKAAVAIAPLSLEKDESIGSQPIPAARAVPYMVLVGGNDEDTAPGDAARAYDLMAPEETEKLQSDTRRRSRSIRRGR